MIAVRCVVAVLFVCTVTASDATAQRYDRRPVVGVALGGGSAKGFAHVGVIRWFEEHRIPIDRIAGTSMGGLIGGAYASGMSSAELDSLLVHTNWNDVFGSSTYSYKTIARKQDARAYPSWLEFNLKHGVSLPSSLNRGQQVELMIQRIAGLNTELPSFDILPTPFRTVAVDLRTGGLIVLQDGSLPTAMRATMSIPGAFPPVYLRDWVLVDGGALNNLPADVVRAMGAEVVIAVKVGESEDTAVAATTLFGIANQAVSAMMRANTRRTMAQADHLIVAAKDFGGSDWRRVRELIDDGYAAAEAMKPQLLKYAVDEPSWRRYQEQRATRRRVGTPLIASVAVRGATSQDERYIRRRLARHLNRPLDIARLEGDITRLGGLDRYNSFGWAVDGNALVITANPLRAAPPFLMMSVNVRNPASDEYTFQLAFRHLSYDVVTRNSELRVDLGFGADPHVAAELRLPLGGSTFFTAVSAAAQRDRANLFFDGDPVAQYRQTRVFGQLDLGITPNYDTELRVGMRGGYYDGDLRIGDPRLPDMDGGFWEARFRSVIDKQNSAMIPSRGLRFVTSARYVLDAPDPGDLADDLLGRTNDELIQLELGASHFWSWKNASRRVFVIAGGGTSFDKDPLPTDQFTFGVPLRLDAFDEGEVRGDHYAVLTTGFLNEVARLPDFMGGPVLAGLWLENGSAFNDLNRAQYEFQVSAGIIAETLVGPFWIGYSIGPSARGLFAGIGRLFM